jgi:uncharacterized protein (UPF0333 family)
MRILDLILVILLAASIVTALAFTFEQQTQIVSQSVINIPYWYVDNNTSDVDSNTDKGAHSNFSAQQYGPDSTFDMLSEEKTQGGNPNAQDAFTEGSETFIEDHTPDLGTSWSVPSQGAETWLVSSKESNTANEKSGSVNAVRENTDLRNDEMNVILKVKLTAIDDPTKWGGPAGRIPSGTFDGNNMYCARLIGNPDNLGADVELIKVIDGVKSSLGIYDANIAIDNWVIIKLEIRTSAKKVYINGVERISSTDNSLTGNTYAGIRARTDVAIMDDFLSETDNYELDLEVQWTNVDYSEANEELCIYGGTMGSENIRVDVWDGSSWQNVFSDLSSGWNNATVSSYLTSSTFTIRFKGSVETNDSSQDSWDIDASLLYVWT